MAEGYLDDLTDDGHLDDVIDEERSRVWQEKARKENVEMLPVVPSCASVEGSVRM